MFEADPVVVSERKDISLLIAKMGYKIVSCSSGKECFRFIIKKGRVKPWERGDHVLVQCLKDKKRCYIHYCRDTGFEYSCRFGFWIEAFIAPCNDILDFLVDVSEGKIWFENRGGSFWINKRLLKWNLILLIVWLP